MDSKKWIRKKVRRRNAKKIMSPWERQGNNACWVTKRAQQYGQRTRDNDESRAWIWAAHRASWWHTWWCSADHKFMIVAHWAKREKGGICTDNRNVAKFSSNTYALGFLNTIKHEDTCWLYIHLPWKNWMCFCCKWRGAYIHQIIWVHLIESFSNPAR